MPHNKQTVYHEKRPQDWSQEERLQALLDTGTLSGEALNVWCRERGLFAHQLTAWKTAFCQPSKGAEVAEIRQLKQALAATERELARKEKALAEAAALLVLQKKCQALWEDGDN